MCLIRIFSYYINRNYVILELVIVLENSQKTLRRVNNIVKDSLSSNNAGQLLLITRGSHYTCDPQFCHRRTSICYV
jgi:hypothetical protein